MFSSIFSAVEATRRRGDRVPSGDDDKSYGEGEGVEIVTSG